MPKTAVSPIKESPNCKFSSKPIIRYRDRCGLIQIQRICTRRLTFLTSGLFRFPVENQFRLDRGDGALV